MPDLKCTSEMLDAIEARLPKEGDNQALGFSPMHALIHDARVALAENDQTPVTPELLEALGFHRDDERPYWWINDSSRPDGFDIQVWDDGDVILADEINTLLILRGGTTLGQLHRLASVLGVRSRAAGAVEARIGKSRPE